ncbi:MAG: hypothetical protein H6766_02090 [Candidatus Peribacteria bacterium]|nr:MAG: hypothetical protein H6766_02090 [Candidatus Peribacteria bacterium]
MDSRYGQAVLRGETPSTIQDQARMIIDVMGQKYTFGEIIAQDYALLPDVRRVNEALLVDVEIRGIKTFVSNNVHYIRADDAEAFEVARAIKDNKKIYDEDRRKTIGQYHIVDGARIMETMKRNGYDEDTINQRIDQTQTIADSIHIKLDMGDTLFPNYQVSDEMTELYKQEKGNLVVD